MINQIETLLAQSLLVRQATEAESDFALRKPCLRCPRRLLCEATEGESRFAMLETIREYALDRLEAKGELAIMQQCHAEYFAAWAGQAETQLHGPDQVVWLARLEQEMGNLRVALAWLLAAGQVVEAAGMACALRVFWQRHGHYLRPVVVCAVLSLLAVLMGPISAQESPGNPTVGACAAGGGIALAAPQEGQQTIPVFVTLR